MIFEPDLKALLVVDMQADALPPSKFAVPDMEAVVGAANRAIAACRSARVPVIFTRHQQLPTFVGLGGSNELDALRESRNLGELCPGLDFDPSSDQVMFKQRWSAFAYTDLDLRLSVLPGTQLALAGVVTDGCVQETAYDAFDRHLRIVLIEDAIGACTDGAHNAAMLGMANWVYECRVVGSGAFREWVLGGKYGGWTWTRPHEFPYTTRSLAAEYERLVEEARSDRNSATSAKHGVGS